MRGSSKSLNNIPHLPSLVNYYWVHEFMNKQKLPNSNTIIIIFLTLY